MTQEQPKINETWGQWISSNKTTSIFMAITLICSIVTILSFWSNSSNLKESQDKIVNNQTAQISKIDSVLIAFHKNAQSNFTTNNVNLQKLITDSLLIKIPNLDPIQKAEVAKYTKAIISTSVSELAYKDWIKELNTTLSQKAIVQTQLESKSLLELEFNKIHSEYNALALWGGILTIVFLIFSFYSLFKTDDLVKQGRDGLDKLNDQRYEAVKLNNESRKEYDDLKVKISDFNKDIDALDNRKTKQDAEIKKISDEISIQKVDFAQISKLRAEFVTLFADITQAKKDIVDLQSRMNNVVTFTAGETSDLGKENVANANQQDIEELDEEPKSEDPDSDLEPKDSDIK